MIDTNNMRIEVMLIAKDSNADTTSVSTMIDLDTRKPGWEHGLVRTVSDQAHAGAHCLREQLLTDEAPSAFQPRAPATFEPTTVTRPPASFTPLAQLIPAAPHTLPTA